MYRLLEGALEDTAAFLRGGPGRGDGDSSVVALTTRVFDVWETQLGAAALWRLIVLSGSTAFDRDTTAVQAPSSGSGANVEAEANAFRHWLRFYTVDVASCARPPLLLGAAIKVGCVFAALPHRCLRELLRTALKTPSSFFPAAVAGLQCTLLAALRRIAPSELRAHLASPLVLAPWSEMVARGANSPLRMASTFGGVTSSVGTGDKDAARTSCFPIGIGFHDGAGGLVPVLHCGQHPIQSSTSGGQPTTNADRAQREENTTSDARRARRREQLVALFAPPIGDRGGPSTRAATQQRALYERFRRTTARAAMDATSSTTTPTPAEARSRHPSSPIGPQVVPTAAGEEPFQVALVDGVLPGPEHAVVVAATSVQWRWSPAQGAAGGGVASSDAENARLVEHLLPWAGGITVDHVVQFLALCARRLTSATNNQRQPTTPNKSDASTLHHHHTAAAVAGAGVLLAGTLVDRSLSSNDEVSGGLSQAAAEGQPKKVKKGRAAPVSGSGTAPPTKPAAATLGAWADDDTCRAVLLLAVVAAVGGLAAAHGASSATAQDSALLMAAGPIAVVAQLAALSGGGRTSGLPAMLSSLVVSEALAFATDDELRRRFAECLSSRGRFPSLLPREARQLAVQSATVTTAPPAGSRRPREEGGPLVLHRPHPLLPPRAADRACGGPVVHGRTTLFSTNPQFGVPAAAAAAAAGEGSTTDEGCEELRPATVHAGKAIDAALWNLWCRMEEAALAPIVVHPPLPKTEQT